MTKANMDGCPMLNIYPDSMGGTLADITAFLRRPQLADTFGSIYILPSIYNSDLDRGFSVIDYGLNSEYAQTKDLEALEEIGIDLKLDFILNHASVLSKQFQDLLEHGHSSAYKDFFINWNKFWADHGTMNEEGYIEPDQELIREMFFRKPGLPILMVGMPDGTSVPYWNTFYQEVRYERVDAQDLLIKLGIQYESAQRLSEIINISLDKGKKPKEIDFGKYEKYRADVITYLESKRKYLGQMDLNVESSLVWEFYDDTLKTLAAYGAKIIRLDAFAYASKIPGEKNFMNNPGTWDLLNKVQELANQYELTLLPEIHAAYYTKTYELLSEKGYMTYDFFLPGLIIDALERKHGGILADWARELKDKDIRVVNMLGCHDGIPLLDLEGMLSEEQIQNLIDKIVERGGMVKNLHGQKNVYYQVNATYYSALGEDDRKMLLARAIQIFMPGKPQVWYLDLLAGKNDYEAVKNAGAGGHKEINRTNFTNERVMEQMQMEIVQKQIKILRFRNENPAFDFDADFKVISKEKQMKFVWKKKEHKAILEIDFSDLSFRISGIDKNGNVVFNLNQK